MQSASQHGFVQIPQLGHDERLLDQPPRVGVLKVAAPNSIDGFLNDFTMGIRQVPNQLNIDELETPVLDGFAQIFDPDYVNVGNRQHPTAIIAFRIIEDVELSRMESPNARLVCQATQGSVNQQLPLMNEGSWQGSLAGLVPAISADQRNFEATFVDRQERNIYGDTGARVLVQVADSHETTLEQISAKPVKQPIRVTVTQRSARGSKSFIATHCDHMHHKATRHPHLILGDSNTNQFGANQHSPRIVRTEENSRFPLRPQRSLEFEPALGTPISPATTLQTRRHSLLSDLREIITRFSSIDTQVVSPVK